MKNIGIIGEDIVVNLLKNKGFLILARNKRVGRSEFDVVASKNKKIFVIEVKTRASNTYGQPEEAVTRKKIENYERCYNKLCEEYENESISYVVAAVSYENTSRKFLVRFIKIN